MSIFAATHAALLRRDAAEALAAALLKHYEYDVSLVEVVVSVLSDPLLPGAVKNEMYEYCIEHGVCPKCGAECGSESVVIGVHPYGSTTATEYGSYLACVSCGWKEDV